MAALAALILVFDGRSGRHYAVRHAVLSIGTAVLMTIQAETETVRAFFREPRPHHRILSPRCCSSLVGPRRGVPIRAKQVSTWRPPQSRCSLRRGTSGGRAVMRGEFGPSTVFSVLGLGAIIFLSQFVSATSRTAVRHERERWRCPSTR